MDTFKFSVLKRVSLFIILVFSCSPICIAQLEEIDLVISYFDNTVFDELEKELISLEGRDFIIESKKDSILFSTYKLIDLRFNPKYKEKIQFKRSEYEYHLDFLLNKNATYRLPYFLNYYYTFIQLGCSSCVDKFYYYNDKSIFLCQKDNKQDKRRLADQWKITSLYYAYINRFTYKASSGNNSIDDLHSAITIYEVNKDYFNLTNEQLFFKYYSATILHEDIDDTRFNYLKKAFEYASLLDSLPNNVELGFILLYYRTKETKEELNYINKKFNPAKIQIPTFSQFEYLVNECYISDYSPESLMKLISHCESLFEKGTVNEPQVNTLQILLANCHNKFLGKIYEGKMPEYEEDFIFRYLTFNYNFQNLIETTSLNKYFAIADILKFYPNTLKFIGFEKAILELEIKCADLIEECLLSNDSIFIVDEYSYVFAPSDMLIFFKRKGLTEKGVLRNEFVEAFSNYKKLVPYKNLVETLYLIWDYAVTASDLVSYEDAVDILSDILDFINNNLNTSISLDDLKLKISIANLEDLDYYKTVLDYNQDKYDLDLGQYSILNLEILKAKLRLNPSQSNAEIVIQYFIENYSSLSSNISVEEICDAVKIFFDYNLSVGLSSLSNYLLEYYNDDYTSLLPSRKYLFQKTAGQFYKYIRNYNRASSFFSLARANPVAFYPSVGSFDEFIEDYWLLEQTFVCEINIDLKDSRSIMEEYKQNFTSDSTTYIQLGISDEFIIRKFMNQVQNIALDLERIQLYYEGKYTESGEVLDKMIELQEQYPYFDLFNLKSIRIDNQWSQGKITNNEYVASLSKLYSEYNKPLDDNYYKIATSIDTEYNGINDNQKININISDFEEFFNESINVIKNLSFDDQVLFAQKLAIKMYLLESNLIGLSLSKDQKLKLAEFKLLVDNIDYYNSIITNLAEDQVDQYLELILERNDLVNIEGYDLDKLNALISQITIFEQEAKLSMSNYETLKSISDFQDQLKSNQAYLRYSPITYNGNSIYIVYVITSNDVQIVKIENGNLYKLVKYYLNRIQTQKDDHISFGIFLEPIINILPASINELIVKRDGYLSNVNLESLWVPNENKFVFDSFKVEYIERPEGILYKEKIHKFNKAFLLGNPDFNSTELSDTLNFVLRGGLTPLPYTKDEIISINQILSKSGIKTIATDQSDSNESALYTNIKSDIIHLATHGFTAENSSADPFDWGLLVTGAKETIKNDYKKVVRNDGIIFGAEIKYKNLSTTSLVVLSACQSGVGESNFYGAQNLGGYFIKAGAKNVISTLWPVSDEVTQKFMVEFYENLMLHQNINHALLETKRKMKEIYKHPFYWAPFVLTSNYVQ